MGTTGTGNHGTGPGCGPPVGDLSSAGQRPPPTPRLPAGQDAPGAQGLAPSGDVRHEGCCSAGCAGNRPARPLLLVWTELAGLLDPAAADARLLWQEHSGPVRLTPDTITRLASDADLRFILHHRGEILGSADPTPTISRALRAAVTARDHHCRFPGCQAPPDWCDLHHVRPREKGGPTLPTNLVTLCRRHHTAVTDRHWGMTMTPDGVVTVRRGQRRFTTYPPAQPFPPR